MTRFKKSNGIKTAMSIDTDEVIACKSIEAGWLYDADDGSKAGGLMITTIDDKMVVVALDRQATAELIGEVLSTYVTSKQMWQLIVSGIPEEYR